MTRLTVVAVVAALLPAAAHAQDTTRVPERDTALGLRVPGLKRDSLRLAPLPPFVPSGLVRPESPADAARRWEEALRGSIAARRAARWRAPLTGISPDTLRDPQALLAVAPYEPVRIVGRYADLGMRIDARFETRFDRLRNLRCTAADANRFSTACRGGFPPPRFEPQFEVRTGGVVGERVHLNVDYDTEREFEASNNIQVYYQGLEDEMLRRVQVGNVTFAAPNSRFITGGIPANNFGASAEAQVGALNLSAIFAQQKGNVVRGRVFAIGDRTVQPQDRDVMDRDFEPLRMFFVVDPATLPGYPAVDVLRLADEALPPEAAVREVRLYRRRTATTTAEQQLGGIEAVALREDSPQRAGPFVWELLLEGRDYYLDQSGLWFALANRLDTEDYLAVSYVTAAGDTVGTFPAAARAGAADTLVLIFEPRRAADVPTFRYEMRNAYRVGAVDDVVRETAALRILVAESERPTSGAPTFLGLLGLGQATDANTFDQHNRLFPREQDPGRGAPLRDYYVVFPHLAPFADSATLDPQFRNDSLYRTPTHLLRAQGPTPLFRLRLHYDAAGGDDRRVLSLGGFQIRAGSERILAGGRELQRGTDYTVNYEIGQVTFVNPDSLFRQPTTVTVQYEENPAFAVAPTSIYGAQARYDMGDRGSIGALGLLQRQRTTFTRPQLGFEPSSNFVGGLTADLAFEPQLVTRLLDALPLLGTTARSSLSLNAEIATSRPAPNQLGVAYVETFEEEGGLFLPLGEDLWEYGSRPTSALGVEGGLGAAGFTDGDAALLVWQNLWASGNTQVQFRARDIDPGIRLLGAGENVETILWLTLQPDTIGGLWDPEPTSFRPRWTLPHTPGPRWRSLSLPLSSTGADLSRIEFLEFWLYEDSLRTARNAGLMVAFDFGTVHEDAVAFQPTGFRTAGSDTTFEGRRRAGEGRLDSERDSLTNAFNASIHDVGIHGAVADTIRDLDADTLVRDMPLCRSELAGQLVIYPLGADLVACTRRNGRPDTEDLNNDQHLDSLITGPGEHHFRYVFSAADDRYFVREGGRTAGGATWRLYRIPFRSAAQLQVGDPDIRRVRALRVSLIAPDLGQGELPIAVGVARMKLVGSPWVKRAGTPIAGLSGDVGQAHGEVIASVVSTENADDLGYRPPPGVTDQGSSRGGEFGAVATQINERSLRLLGSDVRPGERAEAFVRFPDGDRNMLGYREMRVWARGRGPGWVERQLSFYVKAAQDENNFYLYRQALDTASWEPEAVVAFSRWLALRAQVEQAYLRGEPPSGAAACGASDTLAWVRCDGPYMVHVRDPGVAPPNLTRVQELAVGFVRDSGAALDSSELWVDDIRLTQVVDDPGYAGGVTARLAAADVAELDLSLNRRDQNFRQLGEQPSYVTTSDLSIGGTVRLERFGLERLGLAAPLTVRFDRASSDPYYLNRTDVEAAGLTALRRPESRRSLYGISLRRTRRGTLWWQRALVDNVAVSGTWASSDAVTELSNSASRTFVGRAAYQVQPGSRNVGYLPGILRGVIAGLPAWLRDSEFLRGARGSRLRWTPTNIALSTDLGRAENEYLAYRSPIATAADTLSVPTRVTAASLRSRAALDFQPFGSLMVGGALVSERDLRDYADSTEVARVAATGRRQLLGADVGFERSRQLTARLSYNPAIASWLRPRLTTTSNFNLVRDPNQAEAEREIGDSAGAFRLPTTFANGRVSELGGTVDWTAPLRALMDDSAGLRSLLARLGRVDLSQRVERRSQFTRAGFDPGLGYQLGFGDAADFREQRGILAVAATERRERRLTTSAQLPLNFGLTASYAQLRSSQWSRRATSQQETRSLDTDWPNVTARWLLTPRGRLASVLTSVSMSAGLRRRLAESLMPSLSGDPAEAVRGTQESRSTPLSLGITWAPRISTNISTSQDRIRSLRTGNLTTTERGQLSADLTFSFRVPPEIAPLPNDVRTSLRYLESDASSCIQRAGAAACVPVSESHRSEITLLLDTDMPPSTSASMSTSYVLTEDVHTNRKFSQFVFTITLRVLFQAGELR